MEGEIWPGGGREGGKEWRDRGREWRVQREAGGGARCKRSGREESLLSLLMMVESLLPDNGAGEEGGG